MSTILDALRKSEQARQQGQIPVYGEAGAGVRVMAPMWLWPAVGAALVFVILTAAVVWFAGRTSGTTQATASPTSPTQSLGVAAARAVAGSARAVQPQGVTPLPNATPTAAGSVPWLTDLPESFRSTLPPLRVTIHVYTPEDAGRILYINNKPLERGGSIDGVVVREIVPEGAVLEFHGESFRVPRPR